MIVQHKADKTLQDKLRRKIEAGSFAAVAKACKVDRGTLGQYLANLPMRTSTFRALELMAAEALANVKAPPQSRKAQPPSSRSTEAAEDGLRR